MKYLLYSLFLLIPSLVFATGTEISIDTGNNGGEAAAGVTTASHTHTTGSCPNRIGILTIQNLSGVNDIATPTWGGTNMKGLFQNISGSGGKKDYVYYIMNPPVGGATVSVTRTNTTSLMDTATVTYCGVDQFRPFVSTSTANCAPGTNCSSTFTNTYFGSWDVVWAENNTTVTAASTNCTSRAADGAGVGRGRICDGNAGQAPGSFSISVTGNGSSAWAQQLMQLRPATFAPHLWFPF